MNELLKRNDADYITAYNVLTYYSTNSEYELNLGLNFFTIKAACI